MLELALDSVLGIGVVWLAWKALTGEDPYRSAVLYIAFGLVMALAWVRLEAPDIALAEAAIGAGLTGALLLDAASQLSRRNDGPTDRGQRRDRARESRPDGMPQGGAVRSRKATDALVPAGALLLGGVVAVGIAGVAGEPGGLTGLADHSLERSGVTHGVTAVLLNFRAFDTLLEVGVLLAAVLAMLVVRRTSDLEGVLPPSAAAPVVKLAAGVLVPLMILMAGYLLWLGTHAPGGAFQAGAVLASAAVLLFLAGHRSIGGLGATTLAVILVCGLAGFLTAGIVTLAAGLRLLELPPAWAGPTILLIEGTLAISIGGTLAALFLGARARAPGDVQAEIGPANSAPE